MFLHSINYRYQTVLFINYLCHKEVCLINRKTITNKEPEPSTDLVRLFLLVFSAYFIEHQQSTLATVA